MGEYYHHKFGLDFRCLRFPGVISSDTNPGGGTTGIITISRFNNCKLQELFYTNVLLDYAVQIFHDALKTRKFQCYLKPDTRLPMMYITDALRLIAQRQIIYNIQYNLCKMFPPVNYVRSLCEFMALPPEALKQRTYNVTAMSFTPEEIVRSVQRHVPDLKVSYAPDSRQQIGQMKNSKFRFILTVNKFFDVSTADSWPQVFDDSEARAEWNWKPQYDIDGTHRLFTN